MIRLFLRRLFAFPGKGGVLPCRDIVTWLSEFIDHELDFEMKEKVRDHLEVCSACRRFVESLENTFRILRSDLSCTIPEELAQNLMANLRVVHRRALEELHRNTSDSHPQSFDLDPGAAT